MPPPDFAPPAGADAVDPAEPIEWAHPLNRGLAAAWLGIPGYAGGASIHDAGGRRAGAGTVALSGGASWAPDSRGFGFVRATGGADLSVPVPYVGGVAGVTYGDSWVLSWWFAPLSYPVLYTAIIDDAGRIFSSFYNTGGTNSFLHNFGALPVGGCYRLSLAYLSTGTTTIGSMRTYKDGVFQNSSTPAGPFWSSPLTVSFGGNPSGSATPGYPTARYGGVLFRRVPPGGVSGVLDAIARGDADEAAAGFPNALRRWSRRAYLFAPAAATAYTLTAAGGAFSLTGQAAAVKAGRVVPAAAGAVSLAGQAAALTAGRVIPADAGAVALTGQPAGLTAGRVIAASVGDVSLTGQAASLLAARTITAGAGALTVTGSAAGVLAGRVLVAGAGSLTLTGQAAVLTRGYTLTAGAGVLSVAGSVAGVVAARLLPAGAGAVTLTGGAADLYRTGTAGRGAGSLALTACAAGTLTLTSLGAGAVALTAIPAGALTLE